MTTTNPVPSQSVQILIAEDSPTQALRLRHILEQHGYQVTAATNGREALQSAGLRKPTLVISDVVMPEMDGYQLCEQIKSDPRLKNVPVILVTTLSDPQDVIRGLECRADNFIIKPYDEQGLLSRIQSVLINSEVHEPDPSDAGVEIYFNGRRHVITSNRLQILNLLLSTYEAAIHRNQELTLTKDDLRGANASLEAANKELETFSYSVSHDLRAPLRSIDGFSQCLLDDCGSQLDDNGKELIGRVRNACRRMGQLIEDLLNLSRLGRGEMVRKDVDLSAMVKLISSELQQGQPQHKVNVRIAEGLIARGDAQLLRVAMENLLGNAWKFTSKRPDAAIEFGVTQQNGDRAFFVRDNGAGFDMAYAEKLFGAFQRLHSANDFPGTGIGLATVRRIIHRHGGRIWAQSAVEQGATFFFSL
ncbi:MAG: hybrid sensor histidine kinase/response regulator [Phycisphaerales bacterium]|nr:hybrid sensor histidine kinase/response regulator [Phycisphaerales bacterium]